MSKNTIITLLAAVILLVITFTLAEEFGETYTVVAPSDSFTYLLEGSETLTLSVVTQNTFDISLSNSSSIDVDNMVYGFTLTSYDSSVDATFSLQYQYDELTRELYMENTIKLVALFAGQVVDVPGLIRDTASMTINVTLPALIPSGADKSVEFAIVANTVPSQPGGFGNKAYNQAPNGIQTFEFTLASGERLELDIACSANFDFTATYYADLNPTAVSPADKAFYYFIELDVKTPGAGAAPINPNGAYRYYYGDNKVAAADTLNIVQFDGAEWNTLEGARTLVPEAKILTQAYQQALGGFPSFNSKRHFAIVSAVEPGSSTDVSTSTPVADSSNPAVVDSSAVVKPSNPIKTVPDVEESADVSSASIRGITFVTLFVVIMAVLGL